MVSLDDLHDSGLKKIEFIWETGELKLCLEKWIDGKISPVEIICPELTSLIVPRFYPWGPSDSINKAWEENSGEAIKLTIEMQSGDVLEARVKSYKINMSA